MLRKSWKKTKAIKSPLKIKCPIIEEHHITEELVQLTDLLLSLKGGEKVGLRPLE